MLLKVGMHQEVKNEKPPGIERAFLAEIRFGKIRSAHRAIFAQAPWRLRNPVAGPGSRRATPDAHLKIRVDHRVTSIPLWFTAYGPVG